MQVIHKYPVGIHVLTRIKVPVGSEVVGTQTQSGSDMVYIRKPQTGEMMEIAVYVAFTGHEFSHRMRKYIGTNTCEMGMVHHVMEVEVD